MEDHASRRWPLAVLASVRLAVGLIVIYVIVLAAATAIERWYGFASARRWVYSSWWFIGLNALVAVNVMFAVLVRLGSRRSTGSLRRRTGFLLTHVGILVLLAGCVATFFWGIDASLAVYEGHASHLAEEEKDVPIELGFQVYLRQFCRQLDPGSTMASNYSSRVDILDRSEPPKTLREDVLITLNQPVDITDPKTGRTYRLFQSSFVGPWRPGDAEYDALARDGRDRIYRSQFDVNYDPGRWPKYIGCLIIVLGIAVEYYSHWLGRKKRG